MSKHTPGPWTAVCRADEYRSGEWPEDRFLQWEVSGPRVPDGRGSFYQGDAQLVAAAPDLLTRAKDVVMAHGHPDNPEVAAWWEDRAEEAIVEGRSSDWYRKETLARLSAAIAKAEGAA